MADQPDFERLGDLLSPGEIPEPPAAPEALLRSDMPPDSGASPSPGVSGAGAPRPPAAAGPAVPTTGRQGRGGSRRRSTAAPPPSAATASDPNQRVALVWADVLGAEIALNARPVQLREGRLVVTTSSSAWAQSLQLMSELVIERINARLGADTVQKAVFRHAGWEEFSPAGGTAAKAVTPSGGAASSTEGAAASPADAVDPASLTPQLIDEEGIFSREERQALADLELLPLSPSVRSSIREAMKAGFVRARQDSGRS